MCISSEKLPNKVFVGQSSRVADKNTHRPNLHNSSIFQFNNIGYNISLIPPYIFVTIFSFSYVMPCFKTNWTNEMNLKGHHYKD